MSKIHPIAKKLGYISNESFYEDYPTPDSYEMKHGGNVDKKGMYWDGKQYRKTSPAVAAGSVYQNGGQYQPLPTIVPAQYQLWQNGGQYNQPLPTIVPAQYQLWENGGMYQDKVAEYGKGGNWIKGAVNPAHKGYCTPMTKSTCTPRRKAFAETMKKHHGFHQYGGQIMEDGGIPRPNDPLTSTGQYGATSSEARALARAQGQPPYSQVPYSDPTGARGSYTGPQLTGTADPISREQAMIAGQDIARKRRPYYDPMVSFANVLDAGMSLGSYLNGMNNAESVHKSAQNMGLTSSMQHMNQPGLKGSYTPNEGYFRIQNQIPTKAGMFYPAMKNGGQYSQYKEGSIHELDDNTIQHLRSLGYELEFV